MNQRRHTSMQVVQRLQNSEGQIEQPVRRESSAASREFILERGAVDKLHHQIVMIRVAKAVKDLWNMRIAQLRENVGLALECRDCVVLSVLVGKAVDHFG